MVGRDAGGMQKIVPIYRAFEDELSSQESSLMDSSDDAPDSESVEQTLVSPRFLNSRSQLNWGDHA